MGDFDFQTTEVKISGFKHLYKALDGLTQIQQSIGLSPLLVEALEPMAATAKAIAPDDPTTGAPYDLGESIEVSTRQRSGAAKSDRALGDYEARAYMGPTKYGYPQAMMQEFGTRKHLPQPYLRPTWDTGKRGALEIIKRGYAARVQHTARLFAVAPNGK
jgi:hypothetical protein